MDRRPPENEGSQPGILAGNHLAEDVLELYSLGKLTSPEEVTAVEDHIFECAYCHSRLDRSEEFVRATRTAAKVIPPDFKRSDAKLMLPLAIAAAIATFFFLPRAMQTNLDPVDLKLTSVRSEGATDVPSSRPLRLNLDLTQLKPEPFAYQVVAASGTAVASGNLSPNQAKVSLGPLASGQYWVRIKSAATQEVLREFNLLVR